MTKKKLLSLYGLKWNPFAQDVPDGALWCPPRIESFIWRVEQLCAEGGFAALTGEPGVGKSCALRALAERLQSRSDVLCGELTRPQARLANFYRELGDLYGVPLQPHNRWAGAKDLRQTWTAHIEASLFRPVLLIDEAQEMRPEVSNELRLLASAKLDSRALITVVLAGDHRLLEKLRAPELRPLESRLRVRLHLEEATHEEMTQCIKHLLKSAGAPTLMTKDLLRSLVEHAAGNLRTLTTMAHELLLAGAQREEKQLDEKLFFDVFAKAPEPRRARKGR